MEKHKKFFESQDPDERIILVVRKHFLVLASPFILGGLGAVLILAALFGLNLWDVFKESEVAKAIAYSFCFVVLLFLTLFSFLTWLVKYLDILVLTNKHFAVIRQDGIFKRAVSVLDLAVIQDVSVKEYGIFQTVLDFGKIDVQTAGETPNFAYNGVGKPSKIQDAIMDAKEYYVKNNAGISSQIINDSIAPEQQKNEPTSGQK